MRRKLALLCLFASIILCLSPLCFAHPGRTDGNGGHHDGDDYHYHHGYPAHDHWDMDGDGDLDCPYNFDDKTNHNSGSSSGGSAVILKPKPTDAEDTQPPVSQEDAPFDPDELKADASPYFAAIIGILMALGLLTCWFNEKIARMCAFIACVIFFFAMIFYGALSIIGWFL